MVNGLLAGCPDARSAVDTFFDALPKPTRDCLPRAMMVSSKAQPTSQMSKGTTAP